MAFEGVPGMVAAARELLHGFATPHHRQQALRHPHLDDGEALHQDEAGAFSFADSQRGGGSPSFITIRTLYLRS